MFNALSDFLIYCRVERRLADLTCKAYERYVRTCLEFLRSQGMAALSEIRTPDLRRFLAQEATHRPAPSSQARTVAALRCFFRFCIESDYLQRDPAQVLRTPKKREALPDVLDRAELSRLLDVPSREGVWRRVQGGKRERDRLLLALFSYGGLRRWSCSASTSMTWTSSGALCVCATRRVGASTSCRSTPASCRCSSPTSPCVRSPAARRCSWASMAGA